MRNHFTVPGLLRAWFALLVLAVCSSLQADTSGGESPQGADANSAKESVVKLFVVSQTIDPLKPWNSYIQHSTGSGFIIDGERILTNAHVVANATFIEVLKHGETERFEAKLQQVSHAADLAIVSLKKKNTEFFKTRALTFGSLPKAHQEVTALGYPIGGDSLSVTRGVVSRIERSIYVHKGRQLISVQIDAAINPGNSGGPVISDGKVVGVVMQSMFLTDNVGYMIPTMVVEHFLDDLKDKRPDGFPSLGLMYQTTESPALRGKYGVKSGQSGVLVTRVFPESPSAGVVKKNDIITHIDGRSIANSGMVEFRHKETIAFPHYVDMHQLGDDIKLQIIRDGKEQDLVIPLTKTQDDFELVSAPSFEQKPSYFIFGGFVFMPLNKDLVNASRRRGDELKLKNFWPTEERKEAVILTRVLPSNSNKGFHDKSFMMIEKLNGKEFKDFATFHRLILTSKEEFIKLEDEIGHQVVIDSQQATKQHKKILKLYNITKDQSSDLEVIEKGAEKAKPKSNSAGSAV